MKICGFGCGVGALWFGINGLLTLPATVGVPAAMIFGMISYLGFNASTARWPERRD